MHYTNCGNINKGHMSFMTHLWMRTLKYTYFVMGSVAVTDERGHEMVQVGIVLAEKHTFGSLESLTYSQELEG